MNFYVIATAFLNNTTNKYMVVCSTKRLISQTKATQSFIKLDTYQQKYLYSTTSKYKQKENLTQEKEISNLDILINTNDDKIKGNYSNQNKINDNKNYSKLFPNNKVLINNNNHNSKNENKNNNNNNKSNLNGKPTSDQLIRVKEQLINHLPKFLQKTHPYSLYTPDVIFENFYKEPGKVTVGVLPYAVQLTLLRWKIHWKFSYAKIEILKITHDEKDGTIKIRWRINGIRGLKSMIQPWKIKAWQVKDTVKNESEWHDGFSILYLRGDGLIYKHRLQRVISNNEEDANETDKNKNLKIVKNFDVGPTM